MNIPVRKTAMLMYLTGALLATTVFPAASAPEIQASAVTEAGGGLSLIEDSVMAKAWIKPGVDLSRYHKIMVVPAGMTFKEVRNPGLSRSATEFPLTDDQKEKLESTVREVFIEELGKVTRYELVDQPGDHVLLVRGAMEDVVSHVPPQKAGRGGSILRSIGEATLVVELRDSMSDEILARGIDRRAATSAFPQRSSSVNSRMEVRNAARRWANLLRNQLDQFATI